MLDLEPLGFLWNYQLTTLQLVLTFDEDMNTSETPPASAFEILVDAVPKVPSSVQWLTNRAFQLNYVQGALNPVAVSCSMDEAQATFRNLTNELVVPFDIAGTEQTISAVWLDDDPGVTVTLTVTPDFDESQDISTADWSISWSAFGSEPDTAGWSDVDIAELILDSAGPPVGIVNAELSAINDAWKTEAGLLMVPFLESNIPEDT